MGKGREECPPPPAPGDIEGWGWGASLGRWEWSTSLLGLSDSNGRREEAGHFKGWLSGAKTTEQCRCFPKPSEEGEESRSQKSAKPPSALLRLGRCWEMRGACAGSQEAPGHRGGHLSERGLIGSSGPAPASSLTPHSIHPPYGSLSGFIQVRAPNLKNGKITLTPTSSPSHEDFSLFLLPEGGSPL